MSQHAHIGNDLPLSSFTEQEINFIKRIYESELPRQASPQTAAVAVTAAVLVRFNKSIKVNDVLVSACFFYYLC
jgi:hypothetical protein